MSSLYTAHSQTGLLLNANENSNEADPRIVSELIERIQKAAINRYPDDSAAELIERYAALHHLDPAGVLAGNGSDATLQLMITALCRDGKALVTLAPDFGMYDFYAGAIDAPTASWSTDWDGSFDLDAFARFARDNKAGLVLFSNPNNPTGHVCTRDEIIRLAEAVAPAVLAVDEAYMDFSDQSVLDLAQSIDNLIVTRTLSKAWGLAGIRVGFLIASTALTERLRPWKIVYSVSTLDQCAALAGLAWPQIHEDYVALVRQESCRIKSELEKLGVRTGPFEANFYSLSLGSVEANKTLEDAFEQAGIAVRTWPDSQRIRVTIGLPEQNEQALDIIRSAIGADREEC